MRTLRFLLRKEFLQIVRDRAMLRLLIAMPIVQLLILSSAATFEIRSSRTWVIDDDHSAMSRGLTQRLQVSGRFDVTHTGGSMRRADRALLDREVTTILRIPDGFERDIVRTGRAEVQLIFNAEDGAAAGILRAYAARILSAYARELEQETPRWGTRVAGGGMPPISVVTRGWYNPDLDYSAFMVPGILVILVTIIGTTVGAMNVVREKEIGTLEQLNVTPITKAQFIASKLLPFWLIALGELALGLVVGWLVFDIPMRGSLLLVFGAAAIYLLAALGIGLWISTVAETQQQAMFVSFALNMLYLLMSGLFTPVQSMPEWAQAVAQISPVKHFIVIMRAVLVKGAGPADVATPLIVLAVFGSAALALAVRQYSKTSA
ncbi:MAG: ABC transporter permease [Gemmatimonadota bacterium]